jgi:hypothetical protein
LIDFVRGIACIPAGLNLLKAHYRPLPVGLFIGHLSEKAIETSLAEATSMSNAEV